MYVTMYFNNNAYDLYNYLCAATSHLEFIPHIFKIVIVIILLLQTVLIGVVIAIL